MKRLGKVLDIMFVRNFIKNGLINFFIDQNFTYY